MAGTYGDVKTQFSALLNRRDATTDQKETWLQQGFERIQRELRIPTMQQVLTYTVGSDYDDLPIPTDYLQLDTMTRISATEPGTIDRRKLNEVLADRMFTGIPRIFARRGNKWLLGPTPTEGTVIRVDYYADYPAVSADADTNLITLTAPAIAVYAGLSYAGDHFNDKRMGGWEARYNQIKEELEAQGDDDELSGGASVSPANAWPSDY